MKKCTKCKIEKKLKEFYRHIRCKDGFRSSCKMCDSLYDKAYHEVHRDDRKVRWKAYRETHRDKLKAYRNAHKKEIRANHLMRKYGITLSEWQAMFKKQNGKCVICSSKFNNNNNNNIHVDHNHKTGKIRGLLCHFCNSKLVMAIEHPLYMVALKYLKQYDK